MKKKMLFIFGKKKQKTKNKLKEKIKKILFFRKKKKKLKKKLRNDRKENLKRVKKPEDLVKWLGQVSLCQVVYFVQRGRGLN